MNIGDHVIVSGAFARVSYNKSRIWMPIRIKPQDCIFLGFSTRQDVQSASGTYEWGTSELIVSGTIRVAIVMPLDRTGTRYRKPFACPPEDVKGVFDL